ncbi:hypothetical protein QOZ80_8BG0660280 [Eleusine coracana subsp. coracana]|nr:hypothetical protein QOZ80_8BG0660280 [Eleusine coracana subsp. coracana]
MARQRTATIGPRLVLSMVVSLLAAALPTAVAQNLASDRAALLALRDALDPGRRLPWDPAAPTPCNNWRGVTCDASGNRVVELRLPAKSLRGTIPSGTVGNLTALQKLSLRFNAVSGAIPADVGNLAELRGLFLRGNLLDGEIPEGLFSLARLRRLDLAGNRLAGGVSLGFNRLTRLDTLLLEGNQLQGEIPEGFNVSGLAQNGFNVSFNAGLDGAVPASLAGMPATAFLGTGLCGGPLAACAAPDGEKKKKRLSRWAIVGIIVGAVLLILLVMAILALIRWRRRRAPPTSSSAAAADVHSGTAPITVTVARTHRDASVSHSHSFSGASPPAAKIAGEGGEKQQQQLVFLGGAPDRPYDLDTLLRASAEVLSKGAHGTTYRATLDGGAPVLAVKRLRDVRVPEQEFRERAAEVGAMRHDNLPRLRAYFYGREEKLLVYDFVGNGASLSALLHGNGAPLDFTSRACIALAAARGVAYIHRVGSTHGNIKSSNIVVTAGRDGAFVTGHGVAKLVGAASSSRRGTGYRAPELSSAGASVPLRKSADVYSFGVVVLELLSGRAPGPDGGGGVDLPRWVRSVVQEEWTAEVFDAAIAGEARVEDEMMRMLRLGVECTEQRPDRRPAMDDVEARVERVVEDAARKAEFSSTDGSRSVSA